MSRKPALNYSYGISVWGSMPVGYPTGAYGGYAGYVGYPGAAMFRQGRGNGKR